MKMSVKIMAIAAFAIMLNGCSGKEKEKESIKEVPVKSLKIANALVSKSELYIGNIVESQASSLSFEVSGNVKQVLVSEGEKVAKGQLLAVLHKGNINNNYSDAAATLKQAQDTYSRLSMLYKNKSLPQAQYIEAQTQLEKAMAAERAAKKDMNDCNLYAPYAGMIGERSIDAGSNVTAGVPAFKLVEIKTLKAKVSIPENEIGRIELGDSAKIEIAALNNKIIKGIVTQKGILGNSLSHTYEVKITLINPTQDFIPGLLCNITLSSRQDAVGIVIPASSIQLYENDKRYVWIIKSNNRVSLREVTVGSFTENGVIVLSGLNSGDRIVTEGFEKISEGSLIVGK